MLLGRHIACGDTDSNGGAAGSSTPHYHAIPPPDKREVTGALRRNPESRFMCDRCSKRHINGKRGSRAKGAPKKAGPKLEDHVWYLDDDDDDVEEDDDYYQEHQQEEVKVCH